ncbi:MAG TPA: gliding motility-associated C-terminal domain-containing protein, partial [Bacteroidales bacterium]|nr:gliding motility-associated C-terminal domain-containing protein [Bacteroidales bacterium]
TQTYSNTGCESERASKTVTVIPGPTMPQIVSQSKICQGATPGTLEVKTTNPLEKITWVSSTGTILQQGNSYMPPASYGEQAGIYTFYARNSVDGCPIESSKQVALILEVQPTPLTPSVTKKEFCYTGDPIELYAKGSNVTWYNIDNTPLAQCMNKETCIPGLVSAGEFKFFVSQEFNGCISPLGEVNVVISKPPKPEIIGAKHVCSNTTEIYSVKNYSAENTVTWKVTGNRPMYDVANVESAYTRSIDWLSPGVDTVIAIEENKYGCKGTVEFPVYVTDGPDVDFVTQNPGEEGVIEFTNTSKPQILISNDSSFSFHVDYFWNFGRTDDETVLQNELFFRQQYNFGTHTISLTAVNEAGCRNSISKEIFVDMTYGLYVPNAFAPLNPAFGVRTFKPRGFNMTEFQIYIYDAWGNLMYYSEGVDENGSPLAEWDGMYNGEFAQTGTYIWKIQATFVNGTTWKGSDNNLVNKSTFGNVILIK